MILVLLLYKKFNSNNRIIVLYRENVQTYIKQVDHDDAREITAV